jgi:uncharacterized protein YoaH (UPF0181 family)
MVAPARCERQFTVVTGEISRSPPEVVPDWEANSELWEHLSSQMAVSKITDRTMRPGLSSRKASILAASPVREKPMETHLSTNTNAEPVEALTYDQEMVLERAITKLVLLGRQVGVEPDQMISLLESGLSVVELVEYMANRNRVGD